MKKPSTPKKTTAATPATKSETKKGVIASPEVKNEKTAKPKAAKKMAVKETSIEKACQVALSRLKVLNIDERLQSEIQWCLASYQNDQNPVGLYLMAKRALAIFTVEFAAKTKGITSKLITDLEKAIGNN